MNTTSLLMDQLKKLAIRALDSKFNNEFFESELYKK